MTDLTLEQLPRHELMKRCKEAGIAIKPSDKKDDLIYMLEKGETIHKKKEVKRAPILQEQKTSQSIALLPEDFDAKIAHFMSRGLAYEVCEESGTVKFFAADPMDRSIQNVTCNIDVSENALISSAKSAFKSRGTNLDPVIDDRNNNQASRIRQEEAERKRMKAQILAEIRAEMHG